MADSSSMIGELYSNLGERGQSVLRDLQNTLGTQSKETLQHVRDLGALTVEAARYKLARQPVPQDLKDRLGKAWEGSKPILGPAAALALIAIGEMAWKRHIQGQQATVPAATPERPPEPEPLPPTLQMPGQPAPLTLAPDDTQTMAPWGGAQEDDAPRLAPSSLLCGVGYGIQYT